MDKLERYSNDKSANTVCNILTLIIDNQMANTVRNILTIIIDNHFPTARNVNVKDTDRSRIERTAVRVHDILIGIINDFTKEKVYLLKIKTFLRKLKISGLPNTIQDYVDTVLDNVIDIECALFVVQHPDAVNLACVKSIAAKVLTAPVNDDAN